MGYINDVFQAEENVPDASNLLNNCKIGDARVGIQRLKKKRV